MHTNTQRLVVEILGAAVFVCWTGVAFAQAPSTMFTFRGGEPGYTGICEGFVRQRLGWLNANGRPIPIPAAQQISVIEEIRSGAFVLDLREVVVGFISNRAGAAVPNARAYDLDRSGLIEAYKDAFAAPGGSWFSCTEGGFRVDDAGTMLKGGLIELDGGTAFAGFRPLAQESPAMTPIDPT